MDGGHYRFNAKKVKQYVKKWEKILDYGMGESEEEIQEAVTCDYDGGLDSFIALCYRRGREIAREVFLSRADIYYEEAGLFTQMKYELKIIMIVHAQNYLKETFYTSLD